MRKKVLVAILGIAVILTVIFAYYAYCMYAKPNFIVKNGDKTSIFIDENTVFEDVMLQINENVEQKNSGSFEKIAKYKGVDTKLKSGHYILENGMSNRVFLNRLVGGMQSPVRLRFNNIRLMSDLITRLDKQLMFDSVGVSKFLYNDDYIETLGFDSRTIIAMFLPNTYEVYWNISPDKFVLKMKSEYDKFWNAKGRLEKAKKIGLSPVEVSILASVVEGETNSSYEKPIVAGLYMNRLKRGIPLQADPTVKFAVGDFTLTQILYKHLEVDSPYNTYKYSGLPPGPISMPSIEGIDAVLNYNEHNYIYMCAKETLDGTHNFAVTLSQHNKNAAKYHKALREWQKKR